ncbi:hypothetical protein A2765_05270 [Candidatus Kaiserbacteria bacterium RIFCSPHIGHO2_01_FULL_56_24]|uniref:Uncharacterized protein n=1 Tax=Candidatus Kaiserbacteria bacterium RIFCSPHIGHO2_01_FULL_56_24 TaxID=1798487 RepID=A0A1F6DBT6_9BACT|nr:MAG: hypothetical protein A2765_05270 [Candidatus Kaiserbacteria bacterium RIFCSPHIGHO2_01_FULL_56_24]
MSKVADNATILREVRALSREVKNLRRDIEVVIPSESIEEYAHPKRILASYRRAAKKYPPRRT